MDSHHPDRENLFRLVLGSSSPEETHRIERHLERCRDCRRAVDEIGASLSLSCLESWVLPGYDEAFDNAADRASERLTLIFQEAPTAEALLAELFRQPAAGRRSLVHREERFHTLKLCQLLEARSRDLWTSDPFAALDCAELVVGIAGRLSPLRYGSSIVEDARAVAWGYFANSCRVCSDFWRAEQALMTAWRHHVLAGEDAYTEGELLSFTASLRTLQGRFDEANRSVNRAIALYREGQDSHLEGRELIKQGMTLGYSGDWLAAVGSIRQGISRIDPLEEPRLELMAWHNLVWSLNEAGAHREALKHLEKMRFLYKDFGDPTSLARLLWLEGAVALKQGQIQEAKRVLKKVRGVFVENGIAIDVALVSLDLADLYLQDGQRMKLRKLTEDLIPLCDALGLSKEAALARLLYQQSV